MSKSKFKSLPKRFDDKFANDGVWFYPEDVTGKEWPAFKMALADPSSNRYLESLERLADQAKANAPKKGFRQPAKLTKKERELEEIASLYRGFIEVCMIDWTVEDGDDKLVPFTKADAIEFFDPEDQSARWLMTECMKFASDVANFQPEDQDGLPEGN